VPTLVWGLGLGVGVARGASCPPQPAITAQSPISATTPRRPTAAA
jgi:hypothetical protein